MTYKQGWLGMSVIVASDDSSRQLSSLWQHPYYDRRKSMGVINRRHLGVGGRRSSENRALTASNTYVDIYERSLVVKALLLVLLSAMDATFTQILLAAGAQELNGVVSYMLGSIGGVFIPIKLAVTGLAAIFLVVHHNFIIYRVVPVRKVLRAMVVAYAALILYELYLLAFLVS